MNVIYKFAILAAAAMVVIAAPIKRAEVRNTSATPIPLSEQSILPVSQTLASGSFSGRGTWFTDDFGSCGTDFDTNDMIVALNAAQMGGTEQCGRSVRITANGKTVYGKVVDTCPSQYCAFGALDLSQALFKQLSPLSTGVIQLKWEFADSN
ncbi:hypothetical protein BGZ76_005468 [Entomortierella beljakovae]|nr:hypothetical protein BGZ76_005468 [Entomortierella beljakovae]